MFASPPAAQAVELLPGLAVHTFTCHESSHLIVRNGQSLLIDCHDPGLRATIAERGLPMPGMILHTHVQPGHTREGDAFPEARIMVHHDDRTLASDRAAYERLARTTWDDPMAWGDTLGEERFGVAGSVTRLPPERPLAVAETFKAGDVLSFADLTLEVVALPGHGGRHAVGFLLRKDDAVLALFCGDLLRHPAKLVNIYDLEYAYGWTFLSEMPATLRQAAALGAPWFFPATGPAMSDGPAQARHLADGIDAYLAGLNWSSGQFTPEPTQTPDHFGRWWRHAPGVYQLNNMGNCIVLIDEQGHGLFVDPGPCDYGADERAARFRADLDRLHAEAGLKQVDVALLTHFHGDHIDMLPELRERYPALRVAAWEPLARVVESPWSFPYACRLPWYDVGVEAVRVDDRLYRQTPYTWRGVTIQTVHLPGHCFVHAGYLLTFRGLRLAITGDGVQNRGEAASLGFIIANDSVPDHQRGCLKAFATMLEHEVDLNLGGHGSFFRQTREVYAESLRRMEHAQALLRQVVPEGDLHRACFRPWFPAVDVEGV